MRYWLSMIVTIAWGLWFGGQVTLFLTVTTLFKTFSTRRDIFGEAGNATFHAFEKYQLIVAAVALVGTVLWAASGRAAVKTALFTLLALAAIWATCGTIFITPRIDAMRVAHQTTTPEFSQLHGRSMMVYMCETTLLLIGGILLPLGFRSDAQKSPSA